MTSFFKHQHILSYHFQPGIFFLKQTTFTTLVVGNGRTPGEKHEEGIGRIRQKHGKVGGVLREKMANVGQARGRLAHVQFALSMLEKVRVS